MAARSFVATVEFMCFDEFTTDTFICEPKTFSCNNL